MRRFAKSKPQREPTIALINIVFLMLVFFLVETRALEGQAPPDALVIYPDGRLTYQGAAQVDAASYVASLSDEDREIIRLVPDRALPAETLVALTRDLRAAGAQKVMLVTQRALQ
jgi:biopolymer transport protein ExbD